MILRSGRNLTIRDLESKCRDFTSTSIHKFGSPSNNYNPLNFSLIDNASSLQNNDVQKNKEMKSTRQEEQYDKASN